MRMNSIVIASLLVLGASGPVLAAETATPDGSATVQPITYQGNDGKIVCHHMVHEGQIESIVQCHTQAGWDRLRHEYTQRTILEIQNRSLIQRN